MSELPPHLAAALGRWDEAKQTKTLVAQLELFGVEVAVRRLYLGSTKDARFGTLREVYRSAPKKDKPR